MTLIKRLAESTLKLTDPPQSLAWISTVIGRQVASTSDLTVLDCIRVEDALEADSREPDQEQMF